MIIRRKFASLVAALALAGCSRPVVYVPAPGPGPAQPPPIPGPVDPPPPPPDLPSTVGEALAKVRVGESVASATSALGAAPSAYFDATQFSPATVRWSLQIGGETWLIVASIESGVVKDRQAFRVGVNR